MKEAPRARFRIATYNVHGCVGMDRQRSETRIAAVIAELAVDWNSLPGSRPHQNLCRHLRDVRPLIRPTRPFPTFPTSLPVFAVDHIFLNAALEPVSLNVHRTPLVRMASDHFPLVAELMVR
jgi:endonuclease/exonuclease/phosphatase family metal-dependent hydrolase